MNHEVVLDTHVVLWWASAPAQLSSLAVSAIDEAITITISSISMWEVAMLVAKERITLDRPVGAWMRSIQGLPRVRLLPLSASAAVRAAELTGLHGDPADRLIAATALELRAKLVTKDARLLEWASGHPSVTAIW